MLVVTSLQGQTEALTDYKDLTRKRRVNGERSLSFLLLKTERNADAFDLVQEESIIEYDGEEYRIKKIEERLIGNTPVKQVEAQHVFFDIIDVYQYGTLSNGNKSINEVLSFALNGTGYTFSIIDSFGTEYFENFGNDNALALFKKVLETFQAEFKIVGNDVQIYQQIGSTSPEPFWYKYNIKTLSRSVDTANLCTYIKGFGKKVDEKDIFSGVSKNFDARTGTWEDTTDPYWYTKQVGATFTVSYYGTGVRFWYWADNTGGVWEFVLDGDKKAKVSTWNSTPTLKSIDLFRNASEANHTIVATFKGDDPKHTPSTGKNTAKGWVRYSSTDKTFDVYRLRQGDELYTCTAEYTSPMASVYGIRHAPPLYDDTVTSASVLLSKLQKAINDKPEVSITLEYVEMQNTGFNYELNEGDTVPTIYEPLNIDVDLRVIEITDYPESNKSPTLTLSNARKKFTDVTFDYTKAMLDQIWDGNRKKIRYDVLDEAVKQATEALTNSLTQLEYPPNLGIVARDPNDANRFTVLRSAGLGITTNGGETFDNAITPDGINTNLLTAGQIKTNNIQIIGMDDLFYWDGNYLIAIDALDPNKFVRLNSDGLYVAKGAITIERSDGYDLIIDGKANFELAVQGGTPQYIDEQKYADGTYVVQIDGPYAKTASTGYVRFDYFRFSHVARYLSLAFYAKSGGAGAYAYVQIRDDQDNVLATQFTNNTEDTNIGITIDLGVPTGQPKLFYAYFKTTSADYPARVRLATKYLTG
jgi:Prophage endopeptidase tail/Prophage endopeptidase tail N-terminal domain